MPEYELTFVVNHLDEGDEEYILGNFDAVIGETHTGDCYVTVSAPGDSLMGAAKAMFRSLKVAGCEVQRLEADLVSRREIAERLGCTVQTVGNWVRGERQKGTPFPRAFSDVKGGVWLWGDVIAWLRQSGSEDPANGMLFPSRDDLTRFNFWLLEHRDGRANHYEVKAALHSPHVQPLRDDWGASRPARRSAFRVQGKA